MQDKTKILTYFTYGLLLLSLSLLINDVRDFNTDQFKDFVSWSRDANKNESWLPGKNAIQWSYYAVSAALFFWRAYLIYAFSIFLTIIKEIEAGNYFSDTVSKSFKKIGTIFIYYTINVFVLKLIMALIGSYSFHLLTEFKEELLYLVPAGFAFYLLAELFERVKKLKDENDLTI